MPRGKTKFDRCVKAVRRRGGAYDPRAVCGAMRARGELSSDAETLQRGPDRRRNAAGDTFHIPSLAVKDLSAIPDLALYYTKSEAADAAKSLGWRRSDARRLSLPFGRERWVISDAHHNVVTAQGARNLKRNPAGAAAEAFKRFHGRDPREFVTVTKKIHRHGNLWSLGTLRMLKIRTERGQTVKISGFKGAYLAANEQAFGDLSEMGRANLTQLYVEGGDQSVDLKSFSIDPDRAHEIETLGKAIVIDYHTVKVHLGGEGGDAIYRHKFRTTREGDREVTLRVAKFPDVIYRVLDQQLEFSGGSYEIRAEGIDK